MSLQSPYILNQPLEKTYLFCNPQNIAEKSQKTNFDMKKILKKFLILVQLLTFSVLFFHKYNF